MLEKYNAEEFFDKIDFVFIDSDYTQFIPWKDSNIYVLILIKNCIQTKKCLFGTNIVFNTLIYLTITGIIDNFQ